MCVQARLAEEHKASLLLDASRRKYYRAANRHLRNNVLKYDTEEAPVPAKEDPSLQSAPSSKAPDPGFIS